MNDTLKCPPEHIQRRCVPYAERLPTHINSNKRHLCSARTLQTQAFSVKGERCRVLECRSGVLKRLSPGLWRCARGAGLLGWARRVLGIDLSDASVDDWGGLSGEFYRWRNTPLAASFQRHFSIVYGQMCCTKSLSAMNYGVQSIP